MLRLKANKTSFYKLVSAYTKLPPARTAEFIEVYRSPSFWLKWWEGKICAVLPRANAELVAAAQSIYGNPAAIGSNIPA